MYTYDVLSKDSYEYEYWPMDLGNKISKYSYKEGPRNKSGT